MKRFIYFEKQFLLLFIFTIISGVLRKWAIPSSATGNIILLIQLALPFLLTFKHNGFSFIRKFNLIKFFLLYLFISAFNPLNLTLFHGFFGFILHLAFWWLLFYYFENRIFLDVKPLFPVIILFCVFEFALAFIQYQLPSDHFLNVYADIKQLGENQSVALVGNSVRVTGTFSYISGFTAFLIFSIFLIWALIRANYNKRVVSFLLVATIFASFMSGSRTSALITFSVLFLILFSEFKKNTFFSFIKSLFFPTILFFLFFLAKGSYGIENFLSNIFSNFQERTIANAESGEQNQRIFSDVQELFLDFRGKYPFFGVGLGSTYQGATALFGVSDYVKEYGYYENELPRIVLEGGFFLLAFRVILFFWLFSWLELNKISKIVLFIVFIYAIPTVFNIYNSIFLSLGLILFDNVSYNNDLNRRVHLSRNL